jgi:hypothetical protein
MTKYVVYMDEVSTYAHYIEALNEDAAILIAIDNLENGKIGEYVGSEWSDSQYAEEDDRED